MLACVHTALAYSKGVGEREQERAQYSMLVNLSDSTTTSAMDNGPTNLTVYSLHVTPSLCLFSCDTRVVEMNNGNVAHLLSWLLFLDKTQQHTTNRHDRTEPCRRVESIAGEILSKVPI